ncbi:hypothetical protein B0H17DRAFT_1076161 [Mycena rosella]|uniref:Uncharacterized protein n=1 Tax=Mycena rosella TaxID=1033263 RepID=A0AAD7DA09_MYCRO|nr:hypothetical protein B0H17DRAFT_1076161 [Mycena rosella]
MLDSHCVTPLPAYDTKGNIIAPNDYRSKLMGAIVRATISLNIGTSAGKTLMQPTLRVLVAPKDPGKASSSPKKCTRT